MKCDWGWLGHEMARMKKMKKNMTKPNGILMDIDQKQLMAKATHALHRNTGQLDVSWD
jgi:cytochrome b